MTEPARITIVCGPPCAGKNHYVNEHKGPDDVVVDWDAIAVDLGSPRTHHHPKIMFDEIQREYEQRLAELEQDPPTDRDAWIIRALPERAEREKWAARFNAAIVLLTPPRDVLMQRAQGRRHTSWTEWGIKRWFERASSDPAPSTPASDDPDPASITSW